MCHLLSETMVVVEIIFGARRPEAFQTQFSFPATTSSTAQLSVISDGFLVQKSFYRVFYSGLTDNGSIRQ